MYWAATLGSLISTFTFRLPPLTVLVPTILVTEPLRPTVSGPTPRSSLVSLLIGTNLPRRYPAALGRAPLGSTVPKDTTDPLGTLDLLSKET